MLFDMAVSPIIEEDSFNRLVVAVLYDSFTFLEAAFHRDGGIR
jgi:hypothetical protein